MCKRGLIRDIFFINPSIDFIADHIMLSLGTVRFKKLYHCFIYSVVFAHHARDSYMHNIILTLCIYLLSCVGGTYIATLSIGQVLYIKDRHIIIAAVRV